MFTRKGSLTTLALAVATASFVSLPAAAGAGFELGSYSNWPGGAQIAARDYAGAIKAAAAPVAVTGLDPLVAATNLCVAYTVTGAFAEARGACDRAVDLARREDAAASGRFSSETATSRALSNRGVLRAMLGDTAGAAGDFREASKLHDAWIAAERNLAHLESWPKDRVASADAAVQ
jgi:hypothetical protein